MKRHIRHIRILSVAILLASSLLSHGAVAVSRNAVTIDSHLDFVKPASGLSERMEVADTQGGQIGRLISHEGQKFC